MEKPQKKYSNALKFSGIGFQIIAAALLGFFIGYKLDAWMGNTKPYMTMLLAIVFLVAGLYSAVRSMLKNWLAEIAPVSDINRPETSGKVKKRTLPSCLNTLIT